VQLARLIAMRLVQLAWFVVVCAVIFAFAHVSDSDPLQFPSAIFLVLAAWAALALSGVYLVICWVVARWNRERMPRFTLSVAIAVIVVVGLLALVEVLSAVNY
jgi:hypothetical protein